MTGTKLGIAAVGLLCAAGPTSGQTTQSSFDGEWEIIYSCAGATEPYIERCQQGVRDMFMLNLKQQGQFVCGYHLATGHLGNRVDESDQPRPSVNGKANGAVATLTYRSGRTGEIGQATLTRNRDSVVWHVTRPLQDDNWFPDDAVLNKKNTRTSQAPASCGPTQIP